MPNSERPAEVYEDLADWYDRTGQAKLRDWFLVLAADAALTAGHPEDADHLRTRLLQTNPHHLLKPFRSMTEALQSPDVERYVADLRRTYPPEAAASLLATQREAAADRGAHGHPPSHHAAGLSPPPTELFPSATAEPKVFRVQPADSEPRTKPKATPPRPSTGARSPTRPEPAPALPPRAPAPLVPRPSQPGPSVRLPPAAALPREPVGPPRGSRSQPIIEDGATGAWVSSGLFILLLLGSLALAVYTFAGPFLPAGWLR
jgi:hypothetical protein